MKKQIFGLIGSLILLVLTLNLTSAIAVNADYITLYPGEEGKVSIDIENNENFDIESVSITLDLSNLPFTTVGSSTRDIDDLDENDDDSVTFTLKPSTGAIPGDYEIPYTVDYVNALNNTLSFSKEGSFGIRVSAKTELDFAVDFSEAPIQNKEGQISLEVINRGLGEIKSVQVQIFPQGFDLLSKDKIFVGTISSDDSDTATFDVVYKELSPTISAKVTYKDFENQDKSEVVNLPIKVYTQEQALNLGLINKSKTGIYITTIVVISLVWYIWRKIKKGKKKKELMER